MIVCAAVVGQWNNPLFLTTTQKGYAEDALKFHYIVHCALDAIEERVDPPKKSSEPADCYLGHLYPTEDYRIYGYCSSTKIKFVLVLDSLPHREHDEMRAVFRRLHLAYVDAVSNPFYTMGAPITSPKFQTALQTILGSFGGDLP